MSTAAISKRRTPDHLKRSEISYLALEGGGGKGFAYLGALQILEDFKGDNVLARVKGVSGTSAGAITALMLALGLNTKEIEFELDHTDFNSFYDPPQPRLIPRACLTKDCGYLERKDVSPIEKAMLAATLDAKTIYTWLAQIRQGNNVLDAYQSLLLGPLLNLVNVRTELASWLSTQAPPIGTIVAHLNAYLAYFQRDMGLFSGAAARKYLDTLISKRAAKLLGGKPSQYTDMPFRRFQSIFPKELMVCGANLSTGKTVLFSARAEHTQNFPVADAVRISMGLPLIFKPYVVEAKIPGWPPCGTYGDGGLWNNLPFREIDQGSSSISEAATSAAVAGAHQSGRTLALRLGIDRPSRVVTSGDVLDKLLNNVIGAGETQVLDGFKHLAVTLDTTGLTLLEFKPNDKVKTPVTKRSRRRMLQYFGIPPEEIPPQDRDDADDRRIRELDTKSVCA